MNPSTDQSVIVERDSSIVIVTLNRPGAHNALNQEVLGAVHAAVVDAAADPECRAVILTGAGTQAFCSGADLRELQGLTTEQAVDYMSFGQNIFDAIARSGIPVIAAVNGVALGGGFELILASTIAIMSTRASLGLPEAGLGLIPGYGGTQRLPRIIGRQSALSMMLTGARMSADVAYASGLSAVPPVAPDVLMDSAMDIARSVARQGPVAVRSILQAVDEGCDGPLGEGLALEYSLAAQAVSGSESAEGVAAFLGRRVPAFGPRAKYSVET